MFFSELNKSGATLNESGKESFRPFELKKAGS